MNKLSPHIIETPYEIWHWLVQWFLRTRCLKSVDNGQRWQRATYTISSPWTLGSGELKSSITLFMKSHISTSSPQPVHEPWDQNLWNETWPFEVSMSKIWMLSDTCLPRYYPSAELTHKTLKKSSVHESNGCTNEWTNEHINRRTERQKLYTPRHIY